MKPSTRRREPRPELLPTALFVAALSCAGCASGYFQDASTVEALPSLSSAVVTPLHYFEGGRQSVRDYMLGHPDLSEIAARAMAACVRLEIRVSQQGSSYTEVQGSGFLITDGRYVLTSGHSLTNSSPLSIRVTLADGQSFDAEVVKSNFDEFASTNLDLALLRVDTARALPSLEIGEPRSADTVIVPGYPGKHGVNRAGLIVSGQAYRNAPLQPLVALAVVEGVSPIVLRPLAGSIPTGGMSGSPVIDSSGRAVGIFNQVVTTPEKNGVLYSYGASSSLEWWSEISRIVGR
jgi:S1-C subfamily serine protease